MSGADRAGARADQFHDQYVRPDPSTANVVTRERLRADLPMRAGCSAPPIGAVRTRACFFEGQVGVDVNLPSQSGAVTARASTAARTLSPPNSSRFRSRTALITCVGSARRLLTSPISLASMHTHLRNTVDLAELAGWADPIVRGLDDLRVAPDRPVGHSTPLPEVFRSRKTRGDHVYELVDTGEEW